MEHVSESVGVRYRFKRADHLRDFVLRSANEIFMECDTVVRELGERQVRIYLPRGFFGRIIMSYLGSVSERSSRALMSCISALVTFDSVA